MVDKDVTAPPYNGIANVNFGIINIRNSVFYKTNVYICNIIIKIKVVDI